MTNRHRLPPQLRSTDQSSAHEEAIKVDVEHRPLLRVDRRSREVLLPHRTNRGLGIGDELLEFAFPEAEVVEAALVEVVFDKVGRGAAVLGEPVGVL